MSSIDAENSVNAEKFNDEVMESLTLYSKRLQKALEVKAKQRAEELLKKIKKDLKSQTKTHNHLREWKLEQGTTGSGRIIYRVVKKSYGYTFLIEKGHEIVTNQGKITGKRTRPRPHVEANVEEAVESFKKDIEEFIKNGNY